MATLTGQTIADSYEQLLSLPDGGGNGTTHVAVTDGDGGTTFPITLATDAIMITSTNRLEFGDDASYIHQSADGVLDLVSDTEIELNATTIDINGAVDISGNSQFSGTVTVGVDDTGLDVKFFGATAGSYMLWDESDDQLELVGSNVNMGNGYILKEQGKQNHIGSTFSSPYFFMNSATTDNIATASTSILPSGGEDRSVSAWIYPSSTLTNTYNTIVKWGTQSGTYPQYGIVVNKDDSNKIRLLGYGNDVTQTGSEIVQLGKWNHVVLTYSGTTNNLYVNGVHDSSFAFPNGALQTTASSALYIGSFDGTNYNFNGSIGNAQVWNRVLSASEVKELYSGKSVPYEYKGADNTHRVTANAIAGSGLGSVSSASTTGFDLLGSGWGRGGFELSSNLEKGKKYRITYTLSSASFGGESTSGYWSARAVTSSAMSDTNSQALVDNASHNAGTQTADFIANASNYSHITIKASAQDINVRVTNFDIREIGCVAEYDGTGVASDKWFDKSGNDLHATVSGAEVVNAPSGDDGLVYEEGTFTPTLVTSGTGFTSVTYDGATGGKYVRVGNLVHVQGFLSTDAITVGSASGNMAIDGLPYTLSPVSSGLQDGHSSFTVGVSKTWAGENPTRAVADANTTKIGLYYQEHNADYGISVVADVGTGANANIIYFSGTYHT